MLALINLLAYAAISSLPPYFPPVTAMAGFDEGSIVLPLILSTGNLFYVIAALCTPLMMDKIGKKRSVVIGCFFNGLGWIAFASLELIKGKPFTFGLVALIIRPIMGFAFGMCLTSSYATIS